MTRQDRLTPVQVIAGGVVLGTAALLINAPCGDIKLALCLERPRQQPLKKLPLR
jgi:hypothetical protein